MQELFHSQTQASSSIPEIHRGHDVSRDQSYVLFGITQDRLARMMLPIGELTKSEVRSRANQLGLVTATKA